MIGKLVGHYRVLDKIGAGGMGEVFRARDERLGRDVALKLIRPASSDNPDHLHRFEHEARAAAALNHPNIVAIFDVGFDGATPYIVSELLEGKTLRQRLSDGPIPIRTATGYALQIAEALIAAHERRIVHRDLKPENLFLTNDERVKILDFGVAKLQSPDQNRSIESLTTITKHGAVVGTVAYMAPEQLRGKSVDHRSDIFSFGAILYEMLTGIRAFHGETEVDTMTAVLREEPPSANLDQASIPPAYQEVLKHCLEKEPDERFQSAKDLAFALQTISGTSTVKIGDLPHWNRKRKNWLPWTIATVLATAVVVLGLAQLLQAPATQPKYERLTFESGTIYSARFGSDGRNVLYSAAWNNQPVRLFSTVGNSTLSQPLQFSDASLLGVSRTGDNLALVMHGTQSGQLEISNGMLASAPMAGGSPREVLNDVRWADWDLDGKLAVVHYDGGHCRLEYPIGNVLYRSDGWIGNIRFSPDGKSIAFMDHPVLWDNRGRVRVTDIAGHVRTLTQEWESGGGLSWRPDGQEIWFAAVNKGSNLNLMAVDLSGKVRTLLDLPVAINLQDVAPDGRVLVSLNSTRLSMEYSTLDSKEGVDLAWHDWNSAREISRDGKFLLFEDASEAAGPNYAVATRKVDGSLPVRLGEGSSGGLSPDGKWAISILPNSTSQLKLLPLGAGEPKDVNISGLDHLQSGWARFFPDGQHIALNGSQAGHANKCYSVEVSSGVAKPVTPEGVVCGPLSPGGRSLVGTAANRSIAIYSLAGGAPTQVPNFGTNFVAVQWADDGKALYCYRPGEFPSQVYRVEIATGKAEVIKELKPGVTAGVVMVAPIIVSRDGKYFAYSYNQTLSSLYLISGLH